jgi:hypothetical protein
LLRGVQQRLSLLRVLPDTSGAGRQDSRQQRAFLSADTALGIKRWTIPQCPGRHGSPSLKAGNDVPEQAFGQSPIKPHHTTTFEGRQWQFRKTDSVLLTFF